MLTSANRDAEVFEEPDEFRLDRETPHLAFGHGPHKCPGAHVGAGGAAIVLEELLARTARFEVAGDGRDGPVAAVRPGRRCRLPCIR